MTLTIYDISPVNLDGTITSSSTLDLLHGTQSLSSNGDSLFNELDSLDTTQVVARDFDVSGTTHQAHAWEIRADGSLSKWSRNGSASVSAAVSDVDVDVIVVGVPPGVSVPSQPAPQGPPAPGTTQKKVHVKVAKRGALPFD